MLIDYLSKSFERMPFPFAINKWHVAVLPVKAMELESRRKFKSWVGAIIIIQQRLSRDPHEVI